MMESCDLYRKLALIDCYYLENWNVLNRQFKVGAILDYRLILPRRCHNKEHRLDFYAFFLILDIKTGHSLRTFKLRYSA